MLRYFAQGHFGTHAGVARDRTTNISTSGRSALPPPCPPIRLQLQPEHFRPLHHPPTKYIRTNCVVAPTAPFTIANEWTSEHQWTSAKQVWLRWWSSSSNLHVKSSMVNFLNPELSQSHPPECECVNVRIKQKNVCMSVWISDWIL